MVHTTVTQSNLVIKQNYWLTSKSDLSQWQNIRNDVGEDIFEEISWQVWQTEEQKIEDDAEDVKRDESDQDLSKHRLQVHVTSV